ncbi:hypothetical protein BJ170DRAFT_591349 [Xylariales sp. AK1849]|nr:hypothetical protein BJ170DRAFT_591349 [Xylariales sp. AK1849]
MADDEARMARIHAAMMDDLGNNRMEEFAKDDPRGPRLGSFHHPISSRHGPEYTASAQVPRTINPDANAWAAAVAAGAFQDDDARGVGGLDNIADGRLHAIRREQQQSARGGFGGGGGRGGYNNADITAQIRKATRSSESYDPAHRQPYAPIRGNRGRRRFTPMNDTYHLTDLGGLLPPGAETRRWANNQQGGTSCLNAVRTPSPDQPRFASAIHPEPEAQGTRPYQPRPAPVSRPITTNTIATNQPETTESQLAPPRAPVSSVNTATASAAAHLQHSKEQASATAPTIPSHLRSTSHQDGAGTRVPPHMRNTSQQSTAATAVPPNQRTSATIRSETPTISLHMRAASPTPITSSTVPPHMRRTPSISALAVAQPAKPPQATSQVCAASSATTNARSSQVVLKASPNSVNTEGSQPDLRIHFAADVAVGRMTTYGDTEYDPGRTFLYDYPNRQVVIWELRMEDGHVIRDDVRVIEDIWSLGSTAIVRRKDSPTDKIRTTPFRANSMAMVDRLRGEIKLQQSRLAASRDPIYPFTDSQDRKGIRINVSTLLPLAEAGRSPTPPPTTSASVKAVVTPLTVDPVVTAGLSSAASGDEVLVVKPVETLKPEDDELGRMLREMDEETAKKATDPDGMLIDTSPVSPEPRRVSYADDLKGLAYERQTDSRSPVAKARVANEQSVTQSPKVAVKVEPLKTAVTTGPEVPENNAPTLILLDTKDTKGQQVAEAHTDDDGAISAAMLMKIRVGADLSASCMNTLAQLGPANYREISTAFDELVSILGRTRMYQDGSIEEFAAIQVVFIHLSRCASFKSLSREDQMVAAAVVYANLRQLKQRCRITYDSARILALRRHAGPHPPMTDLLHELVQLARRIDATLAPHLRGIGHSLGRGGLGGSRWAQEGHELTPKAAP